MTSIGVLIPTREAAITGDHDARAMLDFARRAEALGFDSVWAGDSLLARPRLEPLTLLAGVAAVTSSVTVGTAALTAPLRNPLLAAHAIATLDRVAEGRVILGLGAGFPYPSTEAEYEAAGVPFEGRVARLLETVKTWRDVWQRPGDDGMPKPFRPAGPPLWLAGGGPKALERAGQWFDGWLPYPPTPGEYAAGWKVVQDAATAAGRSSQAVTPALYVTVHLDEDEEKAKAELEGYAEAYYDFPLEAMAQLQAFVAGAAPSLSRLRQYVEAGAEHIVLRFGSFDAMTHLERAADVLLPTLKG